LVQGFALPDNAISHRIGDIMLLILGYLSSLISLVAACIFMRFKGYISVFFLIIFALMSSIIQYRINHGLGVCRNYGSGSYNEFAYATDIIIPFFLLALSVLLILVCAVLHALIRFATRAKRKNVTA
jgi:hypothetical protein